MNARPYSRTDSAYDSYPTETIAAHLELSAGDRIVPQRSRRLGKWLRRSGLIGLLALGGWSYYAGQSIVPEWLQPQAAALTSEIERHVRAQFANLATPAKPEPAPDGTAPANAAPKLNLAPLPAPPMPPPQLPPAPAETVAARANPEPAANPQTTASLPYAAASETQISSGTDTAAAPYRKRAEAVGLHPDLSRVVLERLTATDYRNAGVAIQTAVAETPDSGTYVWPRRHKPDLALFEVRFVPGAAPDCRRYVVSVIKDGWSTTAMPMEKCGVKRRTAQSK